MNSIFFVFSDFVHENIRVCGNCLDADEALAYVAELDLRFVSSLDLDARALHMSDVAP